MSALTAFAKSELARLYDGKEPDNEYDRMGRDAVLELVETFARQGHSGFSASWVLGMAKRLMAWEPITPLTGEDSEWNDISGLSGEPCWQNNRCSRVFKEADGRAYNIDGRVFREASGTCFTGTGSRVYVQFPYVPATEYIDVGEDGEPLVGPSREELASMTNAAASAAHAAQVPQPFREDQKASPSNHREGV